MPKYEKHFDLLLGPLYPASGVFDITPMFSFDAPSHCVWTEIANHLLNRGWSEEKIKEWLQSKQARWAMDGELGDMLRTAAAEYAAKHIE